MTVSDRLDRIEADIAARGDNEWYIAPTPADFAWLLALARGDRATLEQIAGMDSAAFALSDATRLARERLRKAEGCEYIARSTPLVSIYDEDGNEIGAQWDRAARSAARVTPTLASVDRWYRCARCEYIARSTPLVSIYDEDGNEIGAVWDRCPICGDSYWIWCGGEGRDQREATRLREAEGE